MSGNAVCATTVQELLDPFDLRLSPVRWSAQDEPYFQVALELPCPCNGMVHVRRHNGPLAPRQAWGRRTRVRFFKAGVVVGAETWRSETNSIEASHREIYSRGWQQTMATTPSRIAKNDGNKFRGRHQPRSQNPAGGTKPRNQDPTEAEEKCGDRHETFRRLQDKACATKTS